MASRWPPAASLQAAGGTSAPSETRLLGDGQLTQTEQQVVYAAATGAVVNLRSSDERLNDPAQGAAWGRARTVRAGLLAELLTGVREPENGSLRAVRVSGARIAGRLDLSFSTLRCPLMLEDCYFSEPVSLRAATALEVGFLGCHMPGLDANRLRTQGGLQLGFGFSAAGPVDIAGAQIGGQLMLAGARIVNPNGQALVADELVVEKSMLCRDGFTAEGEVRLPGARIGGRLDLSDARLDNAGGMALVAEGLSVGGTMVARGFAANGEVWLLGAHIGGDLILGGARLTNPQGRALFADQLTIERSMLCTGLMAEGEVHLSTAQIGGMLGFDEATLSNPAGEVALAATLITVEQDLYCSELVARGELHLSGARVGGYVRFNGAQIVHAGRKALVMDGSVIGQAAEFREGFMAQGELRIVGVEIRGTLDFRGASLSNSDGIALVADKLSVRDDVFCHRGFSARGEVRMPYGHIDGWLYLEGAELTNPHGFALVLDQLTVTQTVKCDGITATGEVYLPAASIGRQLSFAGAQLANPDGMAIQAQGITVGSDVFCRDGFIAEGEIGLAFAKIGGILDFKDARLTGHDEVALNLCAARATTLQLLPAECPTGRVVLTDAQVGRFHDDPTTWPAEFDLDGLVYKTLSSTQDVSVHTRLDWLARHTGGYAPQLYEQLGTVYRQAGDEEAARQVAIAKQWQRRRQLNLLGKAWNSLLWATVGYGYRTWRAGAWLAALTVVGSMAFEMAYPQDMVAVSQPPPEFHSVGYTLDVLLPIADLGQQGGWAPQGWASYVSWLLIAAGWVLTTAVVAGVTGVLKRS